MTSSRNTRPGARALAVQREDFHNWLYLAGSRKVAPSVTAPCSAGKRAAGRRPRWRASSACRTCSTSIERSPAARIGLARPQFQSLS